ncbi:MAG TPA: hypothetical protein VLA40_01125, partial [Rheinheimera sp.]|nr:hypothetical protein [Rheinheimera sp.]
AFSGITGTFSPLSMFYTGGTARTSAGDFNFGQRPFAYTAPSGFKALCTQNLPTPTIGATSTTQANDYFNAVLYTGDDTNRTIDCGLQTDFIWTKGRNAAVGNRVSDSVRGASGGLMYNLVTNLTSAENTDTAVTGIVSNGFTLTGGNHPNNTGTTYVAWGWKANGAGGSNTAGTITSTVSANTTSGFSIVTYTGTGANATVGHGIGTAPSMILVKGRSGSGSGNSWRVYHSGANASPASGALYLNSTSAFTTDATAWNSTAPTSTVFSLGTDSGVNSTGTYVAYCFAPVAGYSAFGSYTGNGSTDGPFVYTGFRPRYIMLKKSSQASTTYGWQLYDTSRSPYNQALLPGLWADTSAAEVADVYGIDILSNGFKVKDSNTNLNASGQTIIYAAFAESPFKYALAR